MKKKIILKHKGFETTVKFDEVMGKYHGCIEGFVSPLPIHFYGEDEEKLKDAFIRSVEVYCEVCQRRG